VILRDVIVIAMTEKPRTIGITLVEPPAFQSEVFVVEVGVRVQGDFMLATPKQKKI
jgi:hypothetical protein